MYKKFGKRLFDIIVSASAFIFLLPFFAIIAIMIKLDSKGPVFFLHDRLGKNGKVFKVIKFRTMVVNAENMGQGIKIDGLNDSRITKIGSFLRKTSLDELPQIFNVLCGSMSIVGPRPPATYHPYKFEEYGEEKVKRFTVKPGITGLAQVTVRNSAPWDERIAIDLEYIKKLTFIRDIRIILKTFIKVLRKDNIYLSASAKDKEKSDE